jgi:hypothetical protein
MALGDLYQGDVDLSLAQMAAAPIDPPKPESRNWFRAAYDSLRGHVGAKTAASVLELGAAIGPGMVADLDNSALDQAKKPLSFRQNEQSKPFRDFEKTLRPDPLTSSKAEQIIYNTVGPLASIASGMVLGGLPGLAAAAAEQGFSQSEDLAQQGVDLKTRTAIGTLTAGVNTAMGVVPMAGPTLKATAGLYLLSGPGAFMAQQQATRSILEHADYGELAKQYDPLDPTGLAISALLPAPFAALGAARNIRAGKTAAATAKTAPPQGDRAPVNADTPAPEKTPPVAPPELVDAAMTHNLTLQADAAVAATALPSAGAARVPRSPDLTSTQRAIETRLAEKVGGNFDQAAKEYAALPESRGGKVLNTDIARELSPDYLADRTQSAAVHEPASWFMKQLYAQKLAEPPKPGEAPLVFFTAGGTGAGKTTAISSIDSVKGISDKAQIIYDTNMNTYDSARAKVDQALAAGKDVRIALVVRDPVDALVNGALPRAMRQEQQFGSGRTVPLGDHADTHAGALLTVQRLAQEFAGDPRVRVFAIDNNFGKGHARVVDLDKVKPYTVDVEALQAALAKEYASGRISKAVYEGFSARQNARAASADRGIRPQDRPGAGGQPQPARSEGAGAGADAAPAASGQVAQQPAGASAPPLDPHVQSVIDRVRAVELERPDLPVAEGQTAAQFLADVRREALEGTDTELGAADAQLLKVAADCALAMGTV